MSPALTPHFFAFAQQVSRSSDGLPYVAPVILIRPPGQARTRSFTPWYEASQISSDVALTPERTIADAVTLKKLLVRKKIILTQSPVFDA